MTKQELAELDLLLQAKPKPSLIEFAHNVYPWFQSPNHLRLLAEKLEAVERGEVKRLIVTMPPRHGKSVLASDIYSAWYLGRNPDAEGVIVASYSASRAQKISRRVRSIVRGEQFRDMFPGIELSKDSQSVEEWEIAGHKGGLRAVGAGGSITGHGASLLLIDDPHKGREEAESQTIREKILDWYGADAYTRLEPDGAVVVTATRWHESDLSGHLMASARGSADADQWEQLHLPAIDPDGLPLWPERYTLDRLKAIKANLGSYDWESLYQGNPTPPEGALIKRQWLTNFIDREPEGLTWYRFWDLATSTKTTADYTAGAKIAFTQNEDIILSDVSRGRWEWPDARKIIASLPDPIVGVEAAGFQLAGVQELQRDPAFRGRALYPVTVDKDKLSRALPWAAKAEAGKLFLVRGEWNRAFIDEAITFPLGAHDDQVDAVSGAVQLARGSSWNPNSIIGATELPADDWMYNT